MGLAFARGGSGSPLLLIHGLGSRREIWQPVLPALAAHCETFAIDLPGFGQSPPLPPSRRPDPEALADAVAALIAEEGLDRPHVAGNSLGGWIALELARRSLVRTVTAISPAGFGNDRETAYLHASFILTRRLGYACRPLLPAVSSSALLRTALMSQFIARPWRFPADQALLALNGLVDCPGFDGALEALAEQRFAGGREIHVPVTIAWGDRDRLLLPRQARRAVRSIPGAHLIALPGCGHVPFIDDPDAVAAAILLTTHSPNDAPIRR